MTALLSADLISRWHLQDATLIADTRTSHVFRAKRNGESVVVKCIKQAGEDELNGVEYLRWRDGLGAVRVYDLIGTNCLMEDAGDQTLLQLHRDKGDAAANAVLASYLPILYSVPQPPLPSLPTLNEAMSDLFVHAANTNREELREPLKMAADLAERLLASQKDMRPLHGDIHHANIVSRNGKTWRAIDPKGLFGDPHYDVANLFANPIGATDLLYDPARVSALALMLAETLNLNRNRILQFVIAYAGSSIAWSLNTATDQDLAAARERARLIPVVAEILAQ